MARVWTLQDGQLRANRVRTGISDGIVTAIVDGEVPDGATIVTGVSSSTTASSQPASSPLIPRRPGGNRQGSGTARTQGAGR
jgi:hypothetical protein